MHIQSNPVPLLVHISTECLYHIIALTDIKPNTFNPFESQQGFIAKM